MSTSPCSTTPTSMPFPPATKMKVTTKTAFDEKQILVLIRLFGKTFTEKNPVKIKLIKSKEYVFADDLDYSSEQKEICPKIHKATCSNS